MRRRLAILLLGLALLGAGGTRPNTYIVIWAYPVGRAVDPADVVITLHTEGAIVFREVTNIGGRIRIRTPQRRACYTVSIVVPGARYDAHDWTECPTTHLPVVAAP